MTLNKPPAGRSADDETPGQVRPEVPLAEPAADLPPPVEKAFSELITKGAEEIQDHLSLVARTQVRIKALLETSIEELERAQRLETLTSLIAGGEPENGEVESGRGSFSHGLGERPGAYLEHEIKTLKKMQKLLGVRDPAEGTAEMPAAATPAVEEENTEPEDTEASRKVLIIFRDPGTVRVLRYFLEKEDYEVVTCSSGPEGLHKAAREKPDVILLDVMLPGMDGYQVLSRLKTNNKTARIPVFVLSILAQEADIVKAIDGGATDYFIKPFSPPVIIAKIRRSLRTHHA